MGGTFPMNGEIEKFSLAQEIAYSDFVDHVNLEKIIEDNNSTMYFQVLIVLEKVVNVTILVNIILVES